MKGIIFLTAGAGAVAFFIALVFSQSLRKLVFCDKAKSTLNVPQAEDGIIEVEYTSIERGLFISGGHGWSLGSQTTSFELSFLHEGKNVKWEGPGIPIILQRQDSAYYLATFDRETDFHRIEFRCYHWDGEWQPIPQESFPKRLALANMRMFDSGHPSDEDFHTSLLATFWYCIVHKQGYWQVERRDVPPEFVRTFRAQWIAKNDSTTMPTPWRGESPR